LTLKTIQGRSETPSNLVSKWWVVGPPISSNLNTFHELVDHIILAAFLVIVWFSCFIYFLLSFIFRSPSNPNLANKGVWNLEPIQTWLVKSGCGASGKGF
jgi:hypothetical protein